MADIGKLVRRQLAMFEALRRLGFSAADIFVAYNGGDVRTVLRTRGKQFSVQYVGPQGVAPSEVPVTEAEYIAEWQAGATAWLQSMSNDEREEIYRAGMDEEKLLALVVALDARGMPPPRLVH